MDFDSPYHRSIEEYHGRRRHDSVERDVEYEERRERQLLRRQRVDSFSESAEIDLSLSQSGPSSEVEAEHEDTEVATAQTAPAVSAAPAADTKSLATEPTSRTEMDSLAARRASEIEVAGSSMIGTDVRRQSPSSLQRGGEDSMAAPPTRTSTEDAERSGSLSSSPQWKNLQEHILVME